MPRITSKDRYYKQPKERNYDISSASIYNSKTRVMLDPKVQGKGNGGPFGKTYDAIGSQRNKNSPTSSSNQTKQHFCHIFLH